MEKHYTLATLKLGNLDIELLDLYQLLASSKTTTQAHAHNFWEIHFILNGNAIMYVQEKRYVLTKNTILIIPKDQVHYHQSATTDFEFCAFCFQFKYGSTPPEKRIGEYGYFCELFHLQEACIMPMTNEEKRLISTILSNHNDFSVYAINKVNIETTNLFLEMAKKLDEHKNLQLHSVYTSIREEDTLRKYKIETFIQANQNHPFTIEDLANFLSLSVRQTTRYIKENFHLTFKQLVDKQRMMHAKHLIEQGELPLAKIATEVGYTSYNGFISAYRKYVKNTP